MSSLKLSKFADSLVASEIVRLGASIKDKISKGQSLNNYTIGDFDPSIFPIPQKLEELIIEAYKEHKTSYPSAEGEADLRKSVTGFIKDYLGLDYKPEEVLIAAGGRPLIYAVYKTIVDEGDKVIYPVPSWNNNHYTNFNKGNHVQIEATAENNFMPTAEQIKPHIKGAALIALCSPLNPTGTTFSKDELEKICDLIIEENRTRNDGQKKLYLMFDQIYWALTYGSTKHYDPVSLRPEMKDFTIFVDGISKAFASTGVRVGWSLGPVHVLNKMRSLNSHIGSWAPMAEQKAVAKFLNDKESVKEFFAGFKSELSTRLNKIHTGLQKLKSEGFPIDSIEPQAAIYLTIKIDLKGKSYNGTLLNSQEDVTEFLLSEAKLAVVPFIAFGADKNNPWYRLSVGVCKTEDIDTVLHNLKEAIKKLS
ncbi:MAG: aminotransferase class I/II-fold pyridoxal phosphate-dependent enzyme [Bacteroidetes bacterium]|nr:aminotransferase class I/II-fold pyridoxal phosphate-dependent enzyme [Bacteroidota bacterium]